MRCPLVVVLTVTLSSSILVADSRLEVAHVGCFSSEFAESNSYYKVKTSLTWDQGVQACGHRLTTHMGVARDGSSPGDNIFFCGNDLLLHSEPVDSSQCQHCVGNNGKSCGGSGTISLYKLRESTPFSVLIASEGTGVIQIKEEDDIPILNTLFSFTNKMWDMDYYFEEDEVWFTYRNDTYRSVYNALTGKYIAPRSVRSCGKINRSPYFNWVKNTVYYGCDGERTINELDLNGNTLKVYEPKIDSDMRDLAIDPYRRLAFFSTWSQRVFSYSLDDGILREFVQYGKLFLKGKVMCMDHHEQNLYVIGEFEGEKEKALIRVNYQDTRASVLYKGPELSDPWRMDYFNGTVVWTNYDSKTTFNTAYKCTLSPSKCLKENLKVVFLSKAGKSFSDVKIYHPLKQTPDTAGLCKQLKCSHSCTRRSLFSAQCECPPDMKLSSDKRTCGSQCPPLRSSSLDYKCVLNNRQVSCDSDVKADTTATPRCKENYRMPDTYHSKHTQITCLPGGRWSGKPIECSPMCGGVNGTRVLVPLISNGDAVERGQVPWQAGLYMRKMADGRISKTWNMLCGGTLINTHLVLTAAHCLKYGTPDTPLKPNEIKVGLGKIQRHFSSIEPDSIISDVREVLLPQNYAGEATSYIQDVALLDLVRVIQLSVYIMPACVDWSNIFKMRTGENVHVSGWGRTEDGTPSDILQSAELTFVETNDCINKFPHSLKRYITPDKFCGETKAGREAQVLQGDSGGGMTALKDDRHFVIGVVSTKVSQNNKLSMFTNISNVEHLSWLETQRSRLDNFHRHRE